METVIFDETPLAAYLRDEGEDQPADWVPAAAPPSIEFPGTPDLQQQKNQPSLQVDHGVNTPPPSPPSPSFAPVGQPMVRKRFRNKIPNPLRVDGHRSSSLSSINKRYSRVVASTINRADNAQFLEQFRYTIITSHLLGPSTVGQHHAPQPGEGNTAMPMPGPDDQMTALPGVIAVVASAYVLVWSVSWICSGGFVHLTKKRVIFGVLFLTAGAVVGHACLRQQRLRYVRHAGLSETRTFVTRSQDFDSAASAAISFIKEVELVSRGYRLSAPLPPISRMDDRSQSRRCMRLRKAVRSCFADALPVYKQTLDTIQGFAEPIELEMYYHIYDIGDLDISDAMQPSAESELDDMDSLRSLNIVAARFHTIRRMILCSLLALEANGDESDLGRWTAAVEGLRTLNETTGTCYARLQTILSEVETFPQLSTPKVPLSPNRERWRSQLGKLNSLSTGIRGLQAKLALLREESDRTLNEANDITELGPNLMSQYESIGQDIKMLIQAWEEGKTALASGINRNEKRLSSIGALISPSISLSGLTTVGEEEGNEGNAEDALRALTGGGASPLGGSTVGDPEDEVVFEAMSLPPMRPKSLMTRDERMAKMREDRERRAEAREQADASRGMLRELEMVINLRPSLRPRSGRFEVPPPSANRSSL